MDALRIALAGVQAVDPATAVRSALRRRPGGLWVGGRVLRLPKDPSVHVVAIGKAAAAMSAAATERLGRTFAGGVAVVRDPSAKPIEGIAELVGEHPVPGAGSFAAGRLLLDYVRALSPRSTVLFLISGGSSSLAERPSEGLSDEAIAETGRLLLGSGLPIASVNTIRRHLSELKGGRLATACAAGSFATHAISDVIGDPPQEIGSGPTAPDPTTFADALRAIDAAGLRASLPTEVVTHLEEGRAGRRPETVKPNDQRLSAAPFEIVASNRRAVDGAMREAKRLGYRPWVLSSRLEGEASVVGRLLGEIASEASRRRTARGRPIALLAGGETTVTLPSEHGRGGRNQEVALAAARAIGGRRDVSLLAMGTDGIDGPTDAAGGLVDGGTARRAAARGVDIAEALRTHSAYDALERLGALLVTGPTGTNVSDLSVALIGRPSRPSPGARRASGRRGRPSRPSRRRRS